MTVSSAPITAMPLRVFLISDGRPGHFNLSEGIVAAVARRRSVEVTRLEVRKSHWIAGPVLSTFTNAGISPRLILSTVYGIAPNQLGTPGLIVSAGGNTLAANIAAARMTNAPNIFYGSLRRFRPADFALSMTSYASDARTPNRLMWLKPSKLDPDELDTPPGSHGDVDTNATTKTFGLILGGNAGTVNFRNEDWSELLRFISSSDETMGARWIVANAPRTPDDVSDRFAAIAARKNSPIARFIDVRTAGPGTLGILLAQSNAVVCTADSSTMLSETVWMQRPVVAVSPRDFSLPENETTYRSWLEKNGWTVTMPIAALTPEKFATSLARIKPLSRNPLDQLANELQRRLPALFVSAPEPRTYPLEPRT